jgi:hypothetical protein
VRGGLWTSGVPVGHQIMQPVGYSMRVMVSGQATRQGAGPAEAGQGCQEQESQPDTVRGQRLGQNGKQASHLMDLPDSQL